MNRLVTRGLGGNSGWLITRGIGGVLSKIVREISYFSIKFYTTLKNRLFFSNSLSENINLTTNLNTYSDINTLFIDNVNVNKELIFTNIKFKFYSLQVENE